MSKTSTDLLIRIQALNNTPRALKEISADFERVRRQSVEGEKAIARQSRELDRYAREAARAQKAASKFWDDVGAKGARLSYTVTPAMVAGLGLFTKAYSDLTEAANAAQVTVGSSFSMLGRLAQSGPRTLGLSSKQVYEGAAGFAGAFRSAGLSEDQAGRMAVDLLKRAVDIGSLRNVSNDRVLQALQSGLAGEVEPLRRLNIFGTNEEAVQAEAVRMGLAGVNDELNDSQKILARYQLIMRGSTLAAGDFARTQDETANKTKIAAATAQQASADFGEALQPVVQELLTTGTQVLEFLDALPHSAKVAILALMGFAAVLGPLMRVAAALKTISVASALTAALNGLAGGGAAGGVATRGLLARGAMGAAAPFLGPIAGGALLGFGAAATLIAMKNQRVASFKDRLGEAFAERNAAMDPTSLTSVGAALDREKQILADSIRMQTLQNAEIQDKAAARRAQREDARQSGWVDPLSYNPYGTEWQGDISPEDLDAQSQTKLLIEAQQDAVSELTGQYGELRRAMGATYGPPELSAIEQITSAYEKLGKELDDVDAAYQVLVGRFTGADQAAINWERFKRDLAATIKDKGANSLDAQEQLVGAPDLAYEYARSLADAKLIGTDEVGAKSVELAGQLDSIVSGTLIPQLDSYKSRLQELSDKQDQILANAARIAAAIYQTGSVNVHDARLLAGDTPWPKFWGGAAGGAAGGDGATIGRTLAAGMSAAGGLPVAISNIWAGGSAHSDHVRGRALDWTGSGLATLARRIRAGGGFAEFHGSGIRRHLHSAFGDTSGPALGLATGSGAHISITVPVYGTAGMDIEQLATITAGRVRHQLEELAERSS